MIFQPGFHVRERPTRTKRLQQTGSTFSGSVATTLISEIKPEGKNTVHSPPSMRFPQLKTLSSSPLDARTRHARMTHARTAAASPAPGRAAGAGPRTFVRRLGCRCGAEEPRGNGGSGRVWMTPPNAKRPDLRKRETGSPRRCPPGVPERGSSEGLAPPPALSRVGACRRQARRCLEPAPSRAPIPKACGLPCPCDRDEQGSPRHVSPCACGPGLARREVEAVNRAWDVSSGVAPGPAPTTGPVSVPRILLPPQALRGRVFPRAEQGRPARRRRAVACRGLCDRGGCPFPGLGVG